MSKNDVLKFRAAVYCRVDENNDICVNEYNIGIAYQEAICLKYIEKHGYQVVESLTDFAPRSTLERDGIKRLIEMIKQSVVDAIVIKDFDRIALSIYTIDEFHTLCQKHSVKIISAFHGELYNCFPSASVMRELALTNHRSTKI